MPTVSHLVKRYIADKPFLHEAISRDIVSFGNLAESIHGEIEEEMGKTVNHGAVVMALRRHAEEIGGKFSRQRFDYSSEIMMKTQIADLCFRKTRHLLKSLQKLSAQMDLDRGDLFNIISGNEEISIITNEKHVALVKKALADEDLLNEERSLVSLSLQFNKKFLHTPNVLFTILRNMAWENVNIIEIVSTYTELSLILSKEDAIKAYKVLQELVGK